MIARLRRDPGLALCLLALVLAAALYAPTLGRGLIDHDDPWLLRDNWIAQDASWSSLHAIAFDTSRPIRAVLGAEYLPVRDLSWMLDFALFGTWWPGFHAVNVAVYLAAIALWFAAFAAFGIDRRIAGVAILLWALHPTHAESVAWLSERKGLLALAFAGACALGYAKYRAGARGRWLAVAVVAAVAAVWSKAPAAFAIAGLAGLELALPARRVSWRRSVVALAALGAVTLAAFVPVVVVAVKMTVVATDDRAPAGWLAMAIGMHGFYVRLAALGVANAIAYPIRTLGPSAFDLVLGAVSLAAIIALAVAPRLGRWRPKPELRAASWLWLFGWFPASRLALPLHHVLVADRYLTFATLGVALAAASAIASLASSRARIALVAALALASGLRTLDAQACWRDSVTLWARAVRSSPRDGEAIAIYSEELDAADDPADAAHVLAEGLRVTRHPRVLLDSALALYAAGQRDPAVALLREAADADDPYAASDLARILLAEHRAADALPFARRSVAAGIERAELEDTLCMVALAAGERDEALAACDRAQAMRPGDPVIAFHRARAAAATR